MPMKNAMPGRIPAAGDDRKAAEALKFRRIRRMILTRVLSAPFVIVILVCGVLVYFFAANLRARAVNELRIIADGHRTLIEQFLSDQASALEFAASSGTFDELKNDRTLNALFINLRGRSAAFMDLGVFDDDGNHVSYVGPFDLEGRNYSKTEWFRAAKERRTYISDVFLGFRNVPHFVIAVQRIEKGRHWFLRATIDTKYFNDLVEDIRVGETGEAFLVNASGVFQTDRRSGGALIEKDPDLSLYRTKGRNVNSFIARAADGKRYLYSAGRLSETGWLFVVRQDVADAYAPLARAVAVAVVVIALGGVVVVLTAFVLASAQASQLALADAEKREMGSKLLVAGKLAEVGEMSAGMAHEINNPLQVMISECAMLNDVLADVDPERRTMTADDLNVVKDCVNQLGVQIGRCRNITQGLLKFARKTEATIKDVDLGALMGEVVGMIEHRALIDNIRIEADLEGGIPIVRSDPSQLQQVFLNLLNNAEYAVQGREGAEIRITAAAEGEEVAVSIADNGCGIEPENLKRVFLPFFTTKPVGQGTGLGLSTCYGIVERLGGRISVESEVNTGTVFTVRLPISVDAVSGNGAGTAAG